MVTESPNKKSINGKAPVFVVLQLSGGNDFLSTVVPYNDPHYFEFRNTVGIPEEKSLVIKRKVRQEEGMIINPPILLCSDINKVPLKNGTKVKVACREWQTTNNFGTFTGLDLEAVQVV